MAKDVEVAVEQQPEFSAKDYHDPPPAPLFDLDELKQWSFYRALIAEFIATLLFLYITVLTVIGHKQKTDTQSGGDVCGGVGLLGIAWAFGGMIFILVYCTAGISGGHINPAVTFGLFLGRKVSLIRALLYMIAQVAGAICGCGFAKAFQKAYYNRYSGGVISVVPFLHLLTLQIHACDSLTMGSIPDPGELTELTPPSFDEFQRQTSLMNNCTLLWKELSDHFTSLEQNILKKSEALKRKIEALDHQTQESLHELEDREVSIEGSVQIALEKVEKCKRAALMEFEKLDAPCDDENGEVDNGDGLLLKLKSFCLRMDAFGVWRFVIGKKKELEALRSQMPLALSECVDPPKFVLEAISEVFPVDKRADKSDRGNGNDLGWACILMLESLIPVMADPVIGKSRLLVSPIVKERANEIAETWKASLEERGGIENVKTPDVHTFLQHLVTFGIVKEEDVDLYRKLVIGSAWRKQMPKLAVSLGLGNEMPDVIDELISRGQQLDAVHFTYEIGLVDKFPPIPLLKAYLKDAKKAAASMLEDPNNAGRAAHLAARKEQSALRAVIKCIEDYNLEAEFPPANLKKRLEQLEKVKSEKRKPAAVPANKRTRTSNGNGGLLPPAKAGRLTNAYVSSFPGAPPTYVSSPTHTPYPAAIATYPSPPHMYGSRSPPTNPYAATYSPEAPPPPIAAYPVAPINYPAYGVYGNGMAPAYQQAYYR